MRVANSGLLHNLEDRLFEEENYVKGQETLLKTWKISTCEKLSIYKLISTLQRVRK